MRFTNHFILFLFIFKQCYLELALLIWVKLTGTVFVCVYCCQISKWARTRGASNHMLVKTIREIQVRQTGSKRKVKTGSNAK